jgi:hypothetical protein
MNILVAELIWPEGLDELEASGRVAYDSDLRRGGSSRHLRAARGGRYGLPIRPQKP